MSAQQIPHPDRPMLGIALMLAFCVAAPVGDALAKLLSAFPVVLLIWLRFAMQAVFMTPFMLARGHGLSMSRRVFWLVAARTLTHIGGIGCMFTALRYLPLAEAVAIAFVMPFVLLLFGWLLLGEEVGPRRLGACAVGFLGTVMVIQPSFAAVGAPALLPLGCAVCFALFMLSTRAMAHEIDPFAMQVSSGLMAVTVLLPFLLAGAASGIPALSVRMPQGVEWAFILGQGVIGSASHLLMGWSLRFAPASTLAPMQYLEIPFSVIVGWAIFGHLPNGLAAAGVVVTVAAGLYVIAREQRAASRRAATA
ncbi:MAG: DMT family transporter [Paracoccaceae bacterium]